MIERLKCEMCHKPLKEKRYLIGSLLRPDQPPMVVGPDCFRNVKKAQREFQARKTPEEIAALRDRLAAKRAAAAVTA